MRLRFVYRRILTAVLSILFLEPLGSYALASCPQPQFEPPITLSILGYGSWPQAVVSGDFNNDGLADLLVADADGVSVFLADGPDHFSNRYRSGTSPGPRAVAILDVNDDGNLDFAMASSSDQSEHDGTLLIVHFGDGTGSFEAPVELWKEVLEIEDPRALIAGDFNGDGKADLVLAARHTQAPYRLSWCLGDGAGHFEVKHDGMQYASGVDDPVALGVADFDGDRKSDLVVHSVHVSTTPTTQQDLFVIYGGTATGASGAVTQLSVGESPYLGWTHYNSNSVTVADFNGDAKLDIAVQDVRAGAVVVSMGTGGRQVGPMASYAASGVAVAAGDLNGDGRVDLAVADPASEKAGVLLGDGSGGFGTATLTPSGGFSTSIAIDRFNSADGACDIAVANRSQNSAAILLNACPGSPIDIRATAIEVTQVVQDLANSVLLVAGKRTFARVHVSANYDLLPVTASLQAFDGNGTPLGKALAPGNSAALVAVKTNPARAVLDDAFYFELPAAMTQAGTITLRAVVNPLHGYVEADYGNNSTTSPALTFVPTKPMKLRVVDYSYKRPDGVVIKNDPNDIVRLESDIKSKLPVAVLTFSQVSVYDSMPPADLFDGPSKPEDADLLLSWLQNYRTTKESANAGVLYYLLTNVVKGRSEDIPSWNGVGAWGDAAHEIGHMLGRRHVACSGTEEGADLNYPYPGGKIGGPASDPSRYFGWNTGPDRPGVIPSDAGDLMSYCGSRWLSDYNLTALWNYRQAQPALAPGMRRLQAPTAMSVTGDYLAIYGRIDRITEDLSLTAVTRLATVSDVPPLLPGPYHIRLLDEVGSLLADYPFTANSTTDGGTDALFGQVVDYVPGAREVQVYSDNSAQVLAAVPISVNPPTVTITSLVAGVVLSEIDALTLEWIGGDVDGDALHYDVFYSADHGSTWQLLMTGLSNQSTVIESSQLAGTSGASSGYFRVVASDGVLTGADEAGPITVADKAPGVQVVRPTTKTTFAFGQTVTLEAWAYDLEDGGLDDPQLSWSSNRSGPLGSGRVLHALDLPSGTHTITLTATDREGQVSYASVEVVVSPVAVANRAPAFTSVSPAMTVKEGTPVGLAASASDPDAGQSIAVTASGYPADLTYAAGSAVMPGTAQATISGVVGYSDGDLNPTNYTVDWVASDGTLSASASTELSVMDVVPIGFDLTPGTLNLRSMGRWVTGYLEPPSPFTPADIDTPSIRINESIPADPSAPSQIGDYDGDGIPDLMVKFDRAAVELSLQAGDSVKVVVTGTMAGHFFIGTDYIRVIRAVVTAPAAGAVLTPGATTTIAWTTPPRIEIQSVALLSSLDAGTTWTLEANGLPNVGNCTWSVPNVATNQARVAVVLVENADETGYLVDGVLGTSDTFSIQNVTGVEEAAKAELALRMVWPNPAQEELLVSFGLPDARPARIEVFNVNGRRVAVQEVGGLGPGAHTVTLNQRGKLASGVYLVRLTHAGRKLTTRAVLAH